MRKKPLSLLILLLFVISTLNVNTMVSAVDHPAIYVEPDSTVDPNLTVGMLYTVSIKTDYTGSDIWGWQLSLTYNPSILEGYELANGDLITEDKSPFADFIPGTFNNALGELSKTTAYFFFLFPPPYLTSGPGTLANVTFRVVGIGPSDITLGVDTWLVGRTGLPDYTMYNIIDAEATPDNIGHGYFDNTGAEAYPPYPPVAVITAEPDAYTNEPVTFSGVNSYDLDETPIVGYKWYFGDEATGTGESVDHAYTTVGIYTVTLRVTDGQSQVSEPSTHTIDVKERPSYDTDLRKWKVKPEKHNWVESKDDDGMVTLTALARNLGSQSVDVEITFAILDARKGTPAGDSLVATATLPYDPEVDVTISVDLDPYLYGYDGTRQVLYAHVTLRYDSNANGIYDTATKPKIVRFAVTP